MISDLGVVLLGRKRWEIETAKNVGVHGVSLSGAGSSVVAITNRYSPVHWSSDEKGL